MAKIVPNGGSERQGEIKRLRDEIKNNPKSPEPYFHLGIALIESFNPDAWQEGIKLLEIAIKLNPGLAEAIEVLATEIAEENPARGVRLAKKAIQIHAAFGNTKKACKIMNRAAMRYVYEGWKFFNKNNRVMAKKKAQKALSIYPQCVDAKNILASIHMDKFEFEEAKRIYKEALSDAISQQDGKVKVEGVVYWGEIDTRPYMRSRHGLALCSMHLGRFEEALAEFKTMLDINPNDHQGIRFLIASVYHCLGDRTNAEKYYKKYGEDEGSYNYALLLYSMKQKPQAEKMLKDSLHAAPFIAVMLKSYLEMFNFWQEKGLSKIGEPPTPFMHRNAIISAWNENFELAKDHVTHHRLEAAYDFCNLHGPLWLQEKGSYEFLQEGMNANT